MTTATLTADFNNLPADNIIECAIRCLESRVKYKSDTLTGSSDVKSYLRLQLAPEKNEVFAVLFLDSAHRVLSFERLFYGTVNSTTVHPRVVVQKALELNASAVILSHNHPSVRVKPSQPDIMITRRLKDILEVVDVDLLDHIIVSTEAVMSFADEGLL